MAKESQDFFDKYKNDAINEQIRSGVPASITLAQALIESNIGKSLLTKNANNFFGIKADPSWRGEKYEIQTREVINGKDVYINAYFRKYSSAKQSFHDHSEFLLKNPRYKSLFSLKQTDYKSWAEGLQKAGYSTDPTYAKTLIQIIQQYNLNQYDETAVKKKF